MSHSSISAAGNERRARAPDVADCAAVCALRAETDHRVANHLMMLSSFVRLKGRQCADEGVVDHDAFGVFTRSVDAQIHAIARLHRHLMVNTTDRSSDLAGLLHEVLACFLIGPETCDVVEALDPDCTVRIDQLLPISQIVNEAVTNALKYGIRGSQRAILTVRCKTLASGELVVEVSDTGPGLGQRSGSAGSGGFGLGLMRDLARQLGGTLALLSGSSGLTVRLTLAAPSR